MDAVKRVGEVGHGICGGDGAGAGAEGCYRASMDDGWRVCIAFGVLPRSLHSFRQALISALGSRLGDQVAVSSSRWGTRIFLYAPSAGSADAAWGWRVRPHRRHLVVGADCEDDAKSLARELSGDGRADADTAFRVRRVDIYAPWPGGDALGGGI